MYDVANFYGEFLPVKVVISFIFLFNIFFQTFPATSRKEVTPNPSLEERWDDLAQELSAVMQDGGSMPEMIPFDATLDTPIDEQKYIYFFLDHLITIFTLIRRRSNKFLFFFV